MDRKCFPIIHVFHHEQSFATTYGEALEHARKALQDPCVKYVMVCESVAEVRPLTDSVVIPHPRAKVLE